MAEIAAEAAAEAQQTVEDTTNASIRGIPVKKAGCFIYGKMHNGKMGLIAPYTQGLYDDSATKFYELSKGTLEKTEIPGPNGKPITNHEDELDGALREVEEETGIEVRKALGEEAVQQMRRLEVGQSLPNLPSHHPHYPDVDFLSVTRLPDHLYYSRNGVPRRIANWSIEAANIEKLTRDLKNRDNTNQPKQFGLVQKTLKQRMHERSEERNIIFPPFEDLVTWLRTGDMPECDWNKGSITELKNDGKPPPLFDPKSPPQFIARLLAWEAEHGRPITQEGLFNLLETVPKHGELRRYEKGAERDAHDEKKQYQRMFKQIESGLKLLHIIDGDKDIIGLEDKDKPLIFVQQGADLLSATDLIHSCAVNFKNSAAYARAFGGEYAVIDATVDDPSEIAHLKLAHSQLAALRHLLDPLGSKKLPHDHIAKFIHTIRQPKPDNYSEARRQRGLDWREKVRFAADGPNEVTSP